MEAEMKIVSEGEKSPSGYFCWYYVDMKHWYNVSLLGWVIAVLHLVLSFLIVYGHVTYDSSEPIWYIYNGGFIIQEFF